MLVKPSSYHLGKGIREKHGFGTEKRSIAERNEKAAKNINFIRGRRKAKTSQTVSCKLGGKLRVGVISFVFMFRD